MRGALRCRDRGEVVQERRREGAGAVCQSQSALGRLGEPREVADLCVYLLSDESRFVTGAEFTIDGGLTAR